MRKPSSRDKEWLDIYTDRGQRTLANLCADLKPIEEKRAPEREAGQRIVPDQEAETVEEDAVEELALTYLLNHVDHAGGWVSVSSWCAQREDIGEKVFLEHVVSWLTTEDEDLLYEISYDVDAKVSAHMANQRLEDIRLCRRA